VFDTSHFSDFLPAGDCDEARIFNAGAQLRYPSRPALPATMCTAQFQVNSLRPGGFSID
jgi:hypothetical protein